MNINEMAVQVFEQNKAAGWWDNMDRDINETLMLVVTEIAEATEGVRKDLMDDHLPHRKMEEVELADTLIRLLDLAGRYGWIYYDKFANTVLPALFGAYSADDKPMSPAAQHFALVKTVTLLAFGTSQHGGRSDVHYTELVNGLFYIAELRGYDLEDAVLEKLEYNKHRADHKRENRAAANGKKF